MMAKDVRPFVSESGPLALDPGVAETVLILWGEGFQTFDSGDGVSKPKCVRSYDFPHILIRSTREDIFADVDSLTGLMAARGFPGWRVQGIYDGDECTVFMSRPWAADV